jgi:hypothetical protein
MVAIVVAAPASARLAHYSVNVADELTARR